MIESASFLHVFLHAKPAIAPRQNSQAGRMSCSLPYNYNSNSNRRENTMTTSNWNRLLQEHQMAYFRGDLATSSLQSYDFEEKKSISEAMDASTAAIDAAMRADFEQMPPTMQLRMFDPLGASGTETRGWWERILLNLDAVPDTSPVM